MYTINVEVSNWILKSAMWETMRNNVFEKFYLVYFYLWILSMSAHVSTCLHVIKIFPLGGVFQDFILVFCINKLNLNKDFKIEEMKPNVCFLQAYFNDTNRLIVFCVLLLVVYCFRKKNLWFFMLFQGVIIPIFVAD